MKAYRPKCDGLQMVYAWFRDNGETTWASRGAASNAYCVARDTGAMPRWASRGTPAYAAARAGLDRRSGRSARQRIESKPKARGTT